MIRAAPATSIARLARAGRTLHCRASAPAHLPWLLFFTDPVRTPEPLATVHKLPRGCGVVLRSFGASDQTRQARALLGACRRRGLALLIGAEPQLAQRIGAIGAHMPERLVRGRRPALALVTAAAHSAAALRRAARYGADAAILSPVFASRSPSAGRPLGRRRAAAMAAAASMPVYALGGIKVGKLPLGRFCGIAAVEALIPNRA